MRIHRASLGDFTAAFEPTAAQSAACGFWERLFQGTACQSAGSPGATLPAPSLPNSGAPGTIISSTPIAGMDSSYSGQDANGNPIYVNTPTSDQQQAANVAAMTSEAATALAAAQAAAGNPQAPDCTTFFNMYFNSACPSVLPSGATVVLVLAGAVGFVWILNKLADA